MTTDHGQADGFQAHCETCRWYGSVRLVQQAAARDAQAHDVEEHDGEVPTSGVREISTVDGPEVPR